MRNIFEGRVLTRNTASNQQSGRPFVPKQPNFGLDPTIAGIPTQPIGPQHPVTRDEDCNRIAPASLPNRLRRNAQLSCQISISPGFPKWDRRHRRANGPLKFGTGQPDRNGKILLFPCEIRIKLRGSLRQNRCPVPPSIAPFKRGDPHCIGNQGQRPQW